MYEYKAKIKSVYDGDGAFEAIVDLGMKIHISKKIRLLGIDTPEMRGEQLQAAKVVRDFVRELILDKDVIIHTKRDSTGKYGRLLADIFIGGKNIAEILLDKNYAQPYIKGHKKIWTQEKLQKISQYKMDT